MFLGQKLPGLSLALGLPSTVSEAGSSCPFSLAVMYGVILYYICVQLQYV